MASATPDLQVNSALHPSGVAKLSTSFGWSKGGNVISAGWQVTLCDPMWHVSSRSGVATLRTAIHLLLTYGYLPAVPSHRASPPLDWYQIILLGEQRHMCVNNLPKAAIGKQKGRGSNPRPFDCKCNA